MSTLNSTNMNVSRPTTKVRHAPGGSSSINLSFDEQPVAAKGGFKPVFEASNEIAPEPVVEKPVEEPVKPVEPEVPAVVAAPPQVVSASVSDKVGVVVVGSGSANESLKARTMEVLSSRGVVQVCVGSVFSPLQLPFAVKKMLAKGGFTAVIVVAAFTEEVFAAKEIAGAVMNGIVQVSIEHGVPIVPGFVFSPSDKEAIVKGADCPAAWVTSALALAKPDTFETVSTGPAKVAVPAPEVPPTDETVVMEKVSEKARGAVDTTPVRGRHRGAGPSSIIFG